MHPKEGPGDIGSTGFGEGPGAPSPGGGSFVGPGGQAPPFAPGGPENPYPPSAGMHLPNPEQPPGSAAMQPGFMGSGAPGSGPGMQPMQYPMPMSSVGGIGATGQPQQSGLPGHGTTPGKFQPGGGTRGQMQPQGPGRNPQMQQGPPQQQSQRPQKPPAGEPDEGFLARIIPQGEGGEGGDGGGPEPPIPPEEGGSVTKGKPRGIRTLPMPKDKEPPEGPPKPPGQWVTLDAGKGQPPAYGFIESEDPTEDSGLEPAPKKHKDKKEGAALGGAQKPKEGNEGEQKGHYVPVQVPGKQPKASDEPVWCWVPTIDDTYGVKHEEKEPEKPQETKK